MKRALLGVAGLGLTACGGIAAQQWNFDQVQTDFITCMTASSAPKSYYGFSEKIDNCRSAAFHSEASRHQP